MNSTLKLADHKHKKVAIIMAGIGFMLVGVEFITRAVIIPKLSWGVHLHFCLLVMFTGLFSLAFCKEKVEDERVKLIRSKAMMQGFFFTCAVLLGFSLNVSLFPVIAPGIFDGTALNKDDLSYMGMLLMAFPAFAIVSYLVLFNYGLRNDENWDYNDTVTPRENFRKNKKYILLRTLISLAILAAIIMWGRMSK